MTLWSGAVRRRLRFALPAANPDLAVYVPCTYVQKNSTCRVRRFLSDRSIFFAILLFRIIRGAINPHKTWLFCGQTGRRHLFCMVNTKRRRYVCLRRLFFGDILAYVWVLWGLTISFPPAVSSLEHRWFCIWWYPFVKIPSGTASKTHQSEVEPVCDSLQAGRVFLDVIHFGDL